jgi:rhodanese-related sulfurtransferase
MRSLWLVLVFAGLLRAEGPGYRLVGLEEVKKAYDAHSALFLDARSFEKYRQGTIMRALNVPLKRFKRMKKWLPARKDAALLVFCNGVECGKSERLARKLVQAGYGNVMVYREGYPEWKRRKLPIMAAPAKCRCDGGAYRPGGKPVDVEGVPLYLADEPGRVDARWLVQLLEKGEVPAGLTLVDVRPAEQYARGHLPGAVSAPYDPGKRSLPLERVPDRGAILLYCNHGSISAEAYDSLPDALRSRTLVLDAEVVCEGERCTLEPNE